MENENTQNKARRFRIVVTDLQEDKTLMDVTTNAAIVTTSSPFDNLENVDRDDCTQGAHYFECKTNDILNCIKSTIEGISKLTVEHKELGFLLNLWMMSEQAKKANETEEEDENDD